MSCLSRELQTYETDSKDLLYVSAGWSFVTVLVSHLKELHWFTFFFLPFTMRVCGGYADGYWVDGNECVWYVIVATILEI